MDNLQEPRTCQHGPTRLDPWPSYSARTSHNTIEEKSLSGYIEVPSYLVALHLWILPRCASRGFVRCGYMRPRHSMQPQRREPFHDPPIRSREASPRRPLTPIIPHMCTSAKYTSPYPTMPPRSSAQSGHHIIADPDRPRRRRVDTWLSQRKSNGRKADAREGKRHLPSCGAFHCFKLAQLTTRPPLTTHRQISFCPRTKHDGRRRSGSSKTETWANTSRASLCSRCPMSGCHPIRLGAS